MRSILVGMSETLTQPKFDDAVDATQDFLEHERGVQLDGKFASTQITERVVSVAEQAAALLTSVPYPGHPGLYAPLSKFNAGRFEDAATLLPGYLVLVKSTLVETGPPAFYPAAVSEDGLKTGDIRLHILKQPFNKETGLGYGSAVILSAAGQSETPGIGDHGRSASDDVESEHFATLLAAGNDPVVQASWRSGQHINHMWRQNAGNSVTTEVSERLFGHDIPQQTVTITKEQVMAGKAMLLWHERLHDDNGQPETATRQNALIIVQGLGFQALKDQNPRALDTVKELLA